ncbi:MAG: PCYCGC domain-containing protein [Bacillus sp. (in: Bacteria)]|nr:PCYCGC domain-containing protein [Bacillus sp. (in: firmicutes)]
MNSKFLLGGLFFLLLIVAACSSDNTSEAVEQYNLPEYVVQATYPGTVDAYIHAVDHGDDLQYIPCYCNCWQEPFYHQSVRDCFIDSSNPNFLAYDPHGSA